MDQEHVSARYGLYQSLRGGHRVRSPFLHLDPLLLQSDFIFLTQPAQARHIRLVILKQIAGPGDEPGRDHGVTNRNYLHSLSPFSSIAFKKKLLG